MHDSTCCSGVPPLQRADQKAAKAARQAGAGTLGGGGGSGAASAPTAGWGRFKSTGQVELQASQRAVTAQSMASARAGPGFAGASLTVESEDDEEEGHAAPVAGKQEQDNDAPILDMLLEWYDVCDCQVPLGDPQPSPSPRSWVRLPPRQRQPLPVARSFVSVPDAWATVTSLPLAERLCLRRRCMHGR